MIKGKLTDHGVEKGLKDFKGASKMAMRNTLNIAVSLSRRNAIAEVKKDFTLRNTFTVKSITYEQVPSIQSGIMVARVGALKRADYLKTQEEGGKRKQTGQVTAIGMPGSRFGGSSSRAVMSSRHISKLKGRIVKGSHKKKQPSHKAYAVAQAAVAFKKKKYLKYRGEMFKVDSFSSRSGKVSYRMTHLYHVHKKPIRVKKNTWLQPAILKPSNDLQRIYKSQLRKLWNKTPI